MLLAVALAVLLTGSQDSARVRASLSTARIAAGSTAVLSIVVETGGQAPEAIPVPVLPPGLDLGPISDYSELQVAFPGGRRRVTRREIVVTGTRPGAYRIPAVPVRVTGRVLYTPELQLLVSAGSAGTRPGGSGAALRAWVEPDTVFVGQQVLYQVEAVFPEELRLRLARAPRFEPPVSTGFWTYDLPEPVTVSLRLTGPTAAEVQSFRQVLFPLAAGSLQIPAARLQYEVRQGPAFTPQTYALEAGALSVRVQPLPTRAPAVFTGAVGSFRVHAALSSPTAHPGDPVALRLTIEGAGNIKGLRRPRLDSIPGADLYEGAERVEFGFARGVLSGRKTFEWTLVPRLAGRLAVPPVEFAWFDPADRSYRTAATMSLPLTVTAAEGAPGGAEAVRPIRPRSWRDPFGWARSWWFASFQLLPALGLLALVVRQRQRRRHREARVDTTELELAAALLNQPRACLEQLALWLRQRPGTPDAVALRSRVRAALYAPAPPERETCEELLRAARGLAEKHGGRGFKPGGALLVLLALAATVSAVAPDHFAAGVAAYRAGAYHEAADAFRRQVRHNPRDAAAWYDLGNAAWQNQQGGVAVWAWLRALQLRPRDEWARANLALADAREAVQALAPRVPLGSGEAAAAAALLWWLAVTGSALAWRRRSRGAALGAAACLALLLPLLLLLASRALRPERGVLLAPASLSSAPSLRADTLRTLPAAAPVLFLGTTRGEWARVRSTDLREGWIEAARAGRL